MRTPKEYLYYFLKKQSEKAHRAYYRDYYRNYTEAYRLCTDRKDEKTVRRECAALEKYWRVDPVHYFRYGLYRRDCRLTIDEMKTYIPDFVAYYLLYPKSFKDRAVLCEDKLLMSAVNTGFGIAQPHTLMITRGGDVLSGRLDLMTREQIEEEIVRCRAEKIFVKPTFGVGGKGITIFNRNAAGTLTDKQSGRCFDTDYMITIAKDDYIIQEGVCQHDAMNAVYPHAINTFRLITEYRDGQAHIILGLMRMGSGGMQIDNASSGGIYVKIDVVSGRFCGHAISDDRRMFDAHPDTGLRFDGFGIPMWNEISHFAVAVAEKYAPIRYVGWDIALSVHGPLVIEGNNGPSIEIIQDLYGGVKNVFGIDDPDKLWFSSAYSLKNL